MNQIDSIDECINKPIMLYGVVPEVFARRGNTLHRDNIQWVINDNLSSQILVHNGDYLILRIKKQV